MQFAAPGWWIILPLLVYCAWYWRRLRLWEPLRAVCLLLLVLILTQPRLRTQTDGLDLWVLVDRSASAAGVIEGQLAEWEALLKRSKSSDDRLFFVDFADTPIRRGSGETAIYTGNRSLTATAQAIQYTLAQLSASRSSRLLLLTDGNSTEPLAHVVEPLVRHRIPLDYRLLVPATAQDAQVQHFALPSRVQAGAAFLLELRVTAAPDGALPYEVRRDGVIVRQGVTRVTRGRSVVQFSDRLQTPGAHRYRVAIQPEQDARPGNNQAVGWVEVLGGPRVLLVTAYQNDPLAQVLSQQGIDVIVVSDPTTLRVGQLSGTRAVILNNVAAYHLPGEFLKGLDFFVRVQGGGFLMTGGDHAFGSGGYFGSAVDGLLPVSMELREEHRKYAVAMAIVLDRSGSMSAGVGSDTAVRLTKMDLANEGAAEAIALLGTQDTVTVFAVDSEAHLVVPLLPVDDTRQHVMNTVRAITSQGGGIFVYAGLQAAWDELARASQGQKHMVLFADAADSEQPGNYQALLRQIRRAGGTVSVIGLGTQTDRDAALLKDIAVRGAGRIFFARDPLELPALFAQETVSVARSAFIDEPVGVRATGAWYELAASGLAWLPSVDGYNLTYSRPDATTAVVSTDDYQAPLLAFWQRGAGRVAAVTFPLAGDGSLRARAWADYATFSQTLVQWLMGKEQVPGIGLRVRVDGSQLVLDLLYAGDWEGRLSRHEPRVLLATGSSAKARELVWQRMAPGHYRTQTSITAMDWVRGAVQIGETVLPFGPVAAAVDPEWSFDPLRITELKAVARQSGGRERLDLSTIWDAARRTAYVDLRRGLLLALLGGILLDTLLSRLGIGLSRFRWRLPRWSKMRDRREAGVSPTANRKSRVPPARRASAPTETLPNHPAGQADSVAAGTPSKRRQRFMRAKTRGK